MHRLVWGLALACISLLSACSLVVTGYNHAPQLLMLTWIDPHLDLTSAQSRQTKADLTQLLAWHRQHQLPLYVDGLVRLQQWVAQPMNPVQLCQWIDEMRDSLKPLTEQAQAPVLQLARTLQPAQLETLKARYAKDNKAWRKEWKLDGTRTEQLDVQAEKGQENAERFYGDLSKAQVALLRDLAQASGFEGERTYAERLRQQDDSLQTLQALAAPNLPPDQARLIVRGWFKRLLDTPDEAYAAYLKKRQTVNCEAAAQFHSTTTAEQRAHALKLLKSYEQDLRALMRAPG